MTDAALGAEIEVPTIDGGNQKLKFLQERNLENSLGLKAKECL
jgi:DnaJ-class molecular chaperone